MSENMFIVHLSAHPVTLGDLNSRDMSSLSREFRLTVCDVVFGFGSYLERKEGREKEGIALLGSC